MLLIGFFIMSKMMQAPQQGEGQSGAAAGGQPAPAPAR